MNAFGRLRPKDLRETAGFCGGLAGAGARLHAPRRNPGEGHDHGARPARAEQVGEASGFQKTPFFLAELPVYAARRLKSKSCSSHIRSYQMGYPNPRVERKAIHPMSFCGSRRLIIHQTSIGSLVKMESLQQTGTLKTTRIFDYETRLSFTRGQNRFLTANCGALLLQEKSKYSFSRGKSRRAARKAACLFDTSTLRTATVRQLFRLLARSLVLSQNAILPFLSELYAAR